MRKDIAVVTIGDDMFERIVEDYKNQLNNLFFSASPIATFKDKINEVVNEIEKR